MAAPVGTAEISTNLPNLAICRARRPYVRFSIIPFALLIFPILEIAVFIVAGQYIGLLATLGLIFLTAAIGSVLLRVQGVSILRRLTEENNAGRLPARELVHGGMIVVAGILLLTPGFVTDTIGFLLFVPAVRDAAWAFLRTRMSFAFSTSRFETHYENRDPHMKPSDGVIDLDEDEFKRDPDPNSPWRDK